MNPSIASNLSQASHLLSPAHLGKAQLGDRFAVPKHIARLNKELMEAWYTDNARLEVTLPFQHGKSWLSSHFFPAWILLMHPETRIVLLSYEERYAGKYGRLVRETIERFGAPLGVNLRADSRASNEWVIEGHEGGMVCKGRSGAVTGRPADLLILDDMLKNTEEALSPVILDKNWDTYGVVAYSRLGPRAPIINIGTRYVTKDLFGRIRQEERAGGEQWQRLKFKAIATEDDPLGRKPGEALWPERVPLSRLQMLQKRRPRWFNACWQQEPEDEEGSHFKPRKWPFYKDLGDLWSLHKAGAGGRHLVRKDECSVLVTVDWATSEKKGSDFTAILVSALCPGGELLILEAVNRRVRLEQCVPLLAQVCRAWKPHQVAVEAQGFQTALAIECRRYREIGEVRRLDPGGGANAKLRRALPAIVMGENHRIFLPDDEDEEFARKLARIAGEDETWLGTFIEQVAAFTGNGDDHDDLVDCLAYMSQLAQSLRGPGSTADGEESGPFSLDSGRDVFAPW